MVPSDTHRDGSADDAIDDTRRRSLLKTAAMAATAGALGSLAGCAGSGGGGGTPTPRRVVETRVVKETVEGGTRTVVRTKVVQETPKAGGGKEDTVVSFWSASAVETPIVTEYYRKKLREFEEIQNKEIIVNMQGLSFSNLKTKYATTVEAGAGIPDLAQSGSFGLEQWQNGNVLETGRYFEEHPDIPEKIATAQQGAADYRGTWWSAFDHSFGATQFAILNSAFQAVGVQNPHEDLKTWTQVRRAFDKIMDQKPGNVQFAHEITGTTFDVEQYWGKAHSSYCDGVDPWIDVEDQGSYENPFIRVNENPWTDGIILNNIDMGQAYSSPQHPNRSDEETYPLMAQGTLASQMYGAEVQSFRAQNPEMKFGWPDGAVTGLALPKLDANFGDEYGIDPLAGIEGCHGGHVWSLEGQHTIQKDSQNPDDAWTFHEWHISDPRFLIPFKVDPQLSQGPPSFKPIIEIQQQSKYKEMRTQIFENDLENIANYGDNHITTGALWDIPGANNIRWKDIGTTLSKAYAKEFKRNQAPAKIKEAILQTMSDNGVTPKNP